MEALLCLECKDARGMFKIVWLQDYEDKYLAYDLVEDIRGEIVAVMWRQRKRPDKITLNITDRLPNGYVKANGGLIRLLVDSFLRQHEDEDSEEAPFYLYVAFPNDFDAGIVYKGYLSEAGYGTVFTFIPLNYGKWAKRSLFSKEVNIIWDDETTETDIYPYVGIEGVDK